MVSVPGPWVPSPTSAKRGQLIISYSVPTPIAGQTQITVTGSVVVKAGPLSWYDSNNSLSWSGSLLGSGSSGSSTISLAANGQQTIRSFSKIVTLTSSAQGMTVGFSLSGVEFVGADMTATTTVPIPAQVSDGGTTRPPTPTNFQISYNAGADTFNLTWGGGPVNRIEFATKPLVDGDWSEYSFIGDSTFTSGTSAASPYIGRTYRFRILRRNGSANSNWAYSNVADSTTVPNIPASLSVTQNSDSNHLLKWVFTPTTAEYGVKSFVVERWRASRNEWESATDPYPATRAWSDTTNLINDRIQWRVAAKNGSGRGDWRYSSYVMTTPAKATNVSASRTGPTDAVVRWEVNTPTGVGVSQDLQYQTSVDGGTWTAWANLTGKTNMSGALESTTLSGLNSTLRYRFRIVTRVVDPSTKTVVSDGSLTITLPTTPNAPTPLAPQSYSINSSTSLIRHEWVHNSVDGSPQEAFSLRYRNVSNPMVPGAWIPVTGFDSNFVLLSVGVGDWEWQVRTKGNFATYSQYSDSLLYVVYDPPSVTITSPSTSVITTNRPLVAYTYTDSRGAQKTQIRRLRNGAGDVIEEVYQETAGKSFQFSTVFDNLSSYTIEVAVISNTGLESVAATLSVTTDFLKPGQPSLTGSWNSETGIATLLGSNTTGESLTVYNRLERSVNNGASWELVDGSLGFNPQTIDRFAQLNTSMRWRLVAVSELNTEMVSPTFIMQTDTMYSWLHYGPDLIYSIRLCAEVENDLSFTSGVVTHKLLGRKKRVSVHALGWSPEVTIKVSASVLDEWVGTTERAVMSASTGDVYWRDYQQRRLWAVIPSGDGSPKWKYSFFGFTLEEVEGEGAPRG